MVQVPVQLAVLGCTLRGHRLPILQIAQGRGIERECRALPTTPTQTLVGHNAGKPAAEAGRVGQAIEVQIRGEKCLLSNIQGIFAVA